MRNRRFRRREFLRATAAAGLAPLLASQRLWGDDGRDGRRPNVIVIFTDDQGTLDLNCYGSKDLHTPNLDALAARGTRFSQFYVAAPVCSPSRAALLTGRYPQRAGLAHNAGKKGMPPDQLTIAELLRGAGYRTAIFGKWHLGEEPEFSPLAQGFDEFFGHKVGCIDNYSHFFYWHGPNRHDLWRNDEERWEDGSYFPDLIVREAVRFMEANRDRPFFLYLPFNVPHYPLQAQEKFRRLYKDAPEPRRMYAAFVSTLDEKVGQVLAHVDRLGLRSNTLIVFLSDHGHSTEVRTFGGGGNAGPYRGAKFSLFEGGVRVPCIASLPGRIPEGAVRDQLATSVDWFPTIADLCRVDLPTRRLDGVSLAPILRSGTAPDAHETFHWQLRDQWAVREGDWKLVANGRDPAVKGKLKGADRLFLSNMRADPTERTNLAAKYPDVVARLKGLHEAWVSEVQQQ